MRNLPLNALRAFASAYLTGGIRPAGRALGVSHSSVARHIRELEGHLGAQLVERGHGERALAFTPLGEKLGQEASKSLGALDRTWMAMREKRTPRTVTISATPSFAALWLLPRLPRLNETHPLIEIGVLAEQRVRAPAEEGSDLSIRMGSPRAGEHAIPLMDDALTPVASPEFLADIRSTGCRAIGMEQLVDAKLLHDRDPNASWAHWTAQHGPEGLDQGGGPRLSSSDLLLRAAKQGQGVALARLRLAEDDLTSGALIRLFDKDVHVPDAYWIIENQNSRSRSSVITVRHWLLKEAQQVTSIASGR